MNELQIFHYQENAIRTVEQDGVVWWVLTDVCKVLDISSPHKVAERLADDEKGRNSIPTLGGNQEMITVNESGLYNVILRSDKPEAVPFRRWVTHEVLPSIRKHGAYATAPTIERMIADPDFAIRLLGELKEEQTKRQALEAQIKEDEPLKVFAHSVQASQDSILIGDLAKLLRQNGVQIGQKRLFEWLRQNNYLIKYGASRNMPTQRSLEMDLFKVKESTVNMPDGSVRISRTTKVTGKGQVYFVNKLIA